MHLDEGMLYMYEIRTKFVALLRQTPGHPLYGLDIGLGPQYVLLGDQNNIHHRMLTQELLIKW